MTLEEAIGYVASDELIEVTLLINRQSLVQLTTRNVLFLPSYDVLLICYWFKCLQVTPKTIRLRKKCLDVTKRKSQSKRAKE